MARIRTIKPDFPHSESMGKISRDARLTFILMWTIADDSGRLRANSRMLASLLYPYDDDAPKLITKWIRELESQNCIVVYEADGSQYVQIVKWLNHQKIDRPTPSKIPEPRESSRALVEHSSLDKEGKGEDRKGGEEDMEGRARARDPAGFEQFWNLYPKTNCSRKEALQAYTKAITREKDHETIIRGVEAYNRFLAATGSPAAHATTWLNGDRWTVDYAAATAARAKPVASQPAANSRVNAALAGLYRAGNRHGNQQQSGPVQRSGGTETTGWSKAADGAREAEIVMDDAPGRAASNPGIAGEIIAPLPHAESG